LIPLSNRKTSIRSSQQRLCAAKTIKPEKGSFLFLLQEHAKQGNECMVVIGFGHNRLKQPAQMSV
jgi:hypothetical protein